MKASEAMVPHPFVAVANASASEVAIMFRTRNISVVPVVDDHRARRFLGVVSDRDLVTRCLAMGQDPTSTRADEIMRTDTSVVGPDTELDGAFGFDLDAASTRDVRLILTQLAAYKPAPWPDLGLALEQLVNLRHTHDVARGVER